MVQQTTRHPVRAHEKARGAHGFAGFVIHELKLIQM
jgi:hypothetical protein